MNAAESTSSLFDPEFEEIHVLHHHGSGLRAILAIHDTSLGPAFGGVRFRRYDDLADALDDVRRLARGMTNKCAMAGLPAGGGKVVVMDEPDLDREAAFRFLGKHIESMAGRFFTSRDLGTTTEDMRNVKHNTQYVVVPETGGESDLNQQTANGVFAAIEGCLDVIGIDEWKKIRIAIQGLGEIGLALATKMARHGAVVHGCDIDSARAGRAADTLPLTLVDPDEIYDVPCDVFAPCAVGHVLGPDTIKRLRCRFIAGAANNQLVNDECGDHLHQRDIMYAPDFIVNAGAVLVGASICLPGVSHPGDFSGIAKTVHSIMVESISKGESPHRTASRRAEALWRQARQRRIHSAASSPRAAD